MESVVFVLAVVFILYIIYWSIQNDGAKNQSEQKGLLRMLVPHPDKDLDN